MRMRLLLLLALSGCSSSNEGSGNATPPALGPDFGAWGVQTEYLSDEHTPGDNFYRYVNEGWIETTDLPPGYSFYSEPWVAQERALDDIEQIVLDAASASHMPGSAERRVADLYASFMVSAETREQALGAVVKDLEAMLALPDYDAVAARMADPAAASIFHLRVQPPVDMQGGYMLALVQYRVTGLGLPGQIYYENPDDYYRELRSHYAEYIRSLLDLAGVDRPAERARDVLDLETRYASIMWDFARLRDAGAAFNDMEPRDLAALAPGFPWQDYLAARGVGELERINVGVGAIVESAALFRELPLDAWRSYLAFHWLDARAELLPGRFGELSFDFYQARLYGADERPSRETRALEYVQRYLGDDIGSLYVGAYFPPDRRRAVDDIVRYIRRAFRERLAASRWMDDDTRAEAMTKLDDIIIEIGEPATGIDWAGLVTDGADPVGNFNRILEHRWMQESLRIGQPLVRYGDWNMYPHRIGAGYHQQYNKIFVTAGALLAPFFNPDADAAVNFGAIGQTLAHEFGHALDDQGSRFDRNGALRDWWSAASRSAYEQRTALLIEQFGSYSPLPDVSLAAEQMIGEIVGDLVGTSIAYRAWEMYMEDNYAGGIPAIEGTSGAQRFFMSAAQHQRAVATEDAMRDMALHASHPPAEFRVNGIFRNLDEWYRAFDVDASAALYLAPEERVRFW